MSVSFGKLMNQANKNYEDVSGKLQKLDNAMKNKNASKGPSEKAVQAFLQQKKLKEKKELEKKLEDRKRLIENKAKEDRKIISRLQLVNTMMKPQNSAQTLPDSKNNDAISTQKLSQNAKYEKSMLVAKERLKNDPKLSENNRHRTATVLSSGRPESKKSSTDEKTKSNGKQNGGKVGHCKVGAQPLNFAQLMMQAAKNKEQKIADGDESESDEESSEEAEELIRDSRNQLQKNRHDNQSKEQIKENKNKTFHSKHVIRPPIACVKKEPGLPAPNVKKKVPANCKHIAADLAADRLVSKNTSSKAEFLRQKEVAQKVPAIKHIQDSVYLKSGPSRPANMRNSANAGQVAVKIGTKPPEAQMESVKKPVVNQLPQKKTGKKDNFGPLNQPPKVMGASFAAMKGRINAQQAATTTAPIKRPGTPPISCPPKVMKRPAPMPPYATKNLPSTSTQSFVKKSDQMRAMLQRREMLFKSAERNGGRMMTRYEDQYDEQQEDEEDEYDSSLDDFIDDTEYDDSGCAMSRDQYSQEIRRMFRYDPAKYAHLDRSVDDRSMEASFSDIQREEVRSARLGLLEDLQDIQREQDESRRRTKKSR